MTLPNDRSLSRHRWKQIYSAFHPGEFLHHLEHYRTGVVDNVLAQAPHLGALVASGKTLTSLEFGSGRSEWAYWMDRLGHRSVAFDFCDDVVFRAREEVHAAGAVNCQFLSADMMEMPFRDCEFDLVYGGGVLEHVRDTHPVLLELARVMKPGALLVNTVPALSLKTLCLDRRSIPDLKALRAVFEFVHLKVAKGKYMTSGYQKSFTKRRLVRLHRQAGLLPVFVGRYDVGRPARGGPATQFPGCLLNYQFFWDVVLIEATRP